MISIKIDFDFDDDYLEMFKRAGEHEYTTVQEGKLSLEDIRKELEQGSPANKVFGNKRLGYLKVYDDDTLVGLSLPRVIDKREHKAWVLDTEKTYYRMGMIFIDEPFRGRGIAKEAARQFKQEYKNLLWTIEPTNDASKKVADYIGLQHNVSLYINGSVWKHEPWKHERVLEVWSN